jgi:hypothetical protein
LATHGGLDRALWLLAYRQGLVASRITETNVISAFAVRYAATQGPGARPTDCVARPGRERGVWVIVACTVPDAGRILFAVDRYGREVRHIVRDVPVMRPVTSACLVSRSQAECPE